MGDHAARSPSAGEWWGNCPGAPAYCESLGLKSVGGAAAQWGTKVHGLSEQAIEFILGVAPAPPLITDQQAKEVVEFYTNALFVPEEPLCDCKPKSWHVGVEEKGASPHLPHSSGTMDFVAYCEVHYWLRVVDLKTGFGEVEAERNIQGVIYLLHALLAAKFQVKQIVFEIVQPRAPSGVRVKRWALTPLELLEWLPVIQRKVAASMAPDAPLIAGEKQCKYCPAAAVCPERRKAVTRAAQIQLLGGHRPAPEELAEALGLVPQLQDWIKAVESYAYQQANNGVKIPGYKLVQKRDGNRKWTDEKEAVAELEGRGVDIYEPRKLKSPAQLEKEFDKKFIDPLCTREPGGTVLVEDTDKRPAVVVDKLATFQGLLTK